MSLKVTYTGGSLSGDGRLGKFTGEAHIFKKARNSKGLNLLVAAVAEDSGPFPRGTNACELSIEMITEFFNSDFFQEMSGIPDDNLVTRQIAEIFDRINKVVFTLQLQEDYQANLSLAAVFMIENKMFAGFVGSGQILKINGQDIVELTRGGSWFSGSIKEKGLKTADAIKSIQRGPAGSTFGAQQEQDTKIVKGTLQAGDAIAVFSDGISEFIPNDEIGLIIRSEDLHSGACKRLISIAKDRGLKDHATIVVFSLSTGSADGDQSLDETVGRTKKKKGCSCGGIYYLILGILLLLMIVSAYVGFINAKKIQENLRITPDGTIGRTSAGNTAPEESSGSFILCEPGNARFSHIRLNGKKLDQESDRFPVTEEYNRLEFLPVLEKNTYNVTLKFNSRGFFRVFEGSRRNLVQLEEEGILIYLTKGSVGTVYPQDENGVATVELTGLGSPMAVNFPEENLILKVEIEGQPNSDTVDEKEKEEEIQDDQELKKNGK